MHDYLIVGAGLFGATFARLAMDAGKTCLVIDRRSHTGGNCHSFEWEGVVTHWYGPHFLHTSSPVARAFFERHTRTTPIIHRTRSRVGDKLYSIPVNLDTLHALWGVFTPGDAKEALAERVEMTADPEVSFESRALRTVGRELYELLFKGYTEKMWGRPCHLLPASLFSRLPVRFTCDDRYYDDPWEAVPTGGYTALFSRLLEGATVSLNEEFLGNKIKWMSQARRTLYTGPLDAYYDWDKGELQWRAVDFQREHFSFGPIQPCSVLNNPDARTPWTRVTEFSHIHPTRDSRTTRVMEFPMAHSRHVRKSEPAYPVGDEVSNRLQRRYASRAREDGLLTGGRLGDYKYYNMDETVLAAMRLAEAEFGERSAKVS